MFVFIFLCYPMISNNTFALFSCQFVEDGKSYLKRDFNLECWSDEHRKMAMFIGFPIIIVWIIGFPMAVFVALYRRRKFLDNIDTERMFGLFFVGLNNDSYYWEIIVVNLRKIIFILCSTLMSSVNS